MTLGPDRLLAAVRRRLAWRRAVRAAEAGILVGLVAGLVAQVGTLAFPYPVRAEWVLAGATALGVLAAAASLIRRPGLVEAAWWLDRRCGLQDRMATYLAVRAGLRSELVEDFLQDLHAATGTVRVPHAVPVRPARWRAAVAACAAVLAWDLLLSGATLPNTAARRVAEVVREEGRRLEELGTRWEQEARSQSLQEALRSAQLVRQTGRALESARLTAHAARQQLSALAGRLEATRALLRSEAAQRGLPSEPGEGHLPPWVARALQREVARLGRALEEVSLSGEQAEQLRRMLRRLESTAPLRPESPARQALREAHRRLQRQDRPGAREAVRHAEDAFRELARLLEEEGVLAQHQREVELSSLAIGQAVRGAADPEAAQERPLTYPTMPRNRPEPAGREDPEAWSWEGPQSGLQPGTGTVPGKLGPPTPRLQAQRRQEVLRGEVGEGKTYAGRLAAPGVVDHARTPLAQVPARVVRQADEALRARRVPSPYRDWVRRYFQELAGRGD